MEKKTDGKDFAVKDLAKKMQEKEKDRRKRFEKDFTAKKIGKR